MRDVTVKLYPGLRHEILNEDCRMLVYQDIPHWLTGLLCGKKETTWTAGKR